MVNNAGVNMCVPVSSRDLAFNFLGFILRNEISGSCDNSIFNFLRKLHAFFQKEAIQKTLILALSMRTGISECSPSLSGMFSKQGWGYLYSCK